MNPYNYSITIAPYLRPLTLKKPINLTISTEVLDEAKRLGINISKVCDAFLTDLVKQEKARHWQSENQRFISVYNKMVEEEGLPLDEWRSF